MGMLFNTVGTLRTLEILNYGFDRQGMKLLRASNFQLWDAVYATNFPQGFPGQGTYANFAVPLDLDHDEARLQNRWSTWLTGTFDQAMMPDPAHPGQNISVAKYVGNYLDIAVRDVGNCTRIEFFAVPDVTVHAQAIPIPLQNGKYAMVITLYTTSMDNT